MDINTSLFFLIFNLSGQSPFLDSIMIFGAESLIYLVFILMLVLAYKGRAPERKAIILSLLSLPILLIIIKIIHLFYYLDRPFITYHLSPLILYGHDASFPSRHASISSSLAFSYFFFKSKWTPLFLFFMIWIGLSRIYVGVHYPIDIIGGILTGLVSILLTNQLIKFLKIKFSLT